MKKDQVFEEQQQHRPRPFSPEQETDDPEASDLIELIERDSRREVTRKRAASAKTKTAQAQEGAIPLELLYFRSFGERPLLTKTEEVDLAKKVDIGTRGIRKTLQAAVGLASRMRKTEKLEEEIAVLDEVRALSGLSATALNRAEASLAALAKEARGTSRIAASRVRQFRQALREAQIHRRTLEEGKDELIRRNLRLVVDIAKRYHGRGLGLLDLVQEGNIGLMKAAERYQYRKGFKFSTYATWWVRQGITRALADQSRTIRIPVHLTEASHRITRTSRRLVQQLGHVPRTEEVAKALRVRPEKIYETVQAFQEPVSMENPVGDGDTSLGELIPDRGAVPPDSHVHRSERDREVDRILSSLTPREQLVIRLRFGIGQDEPRTLEQVGQSLSVTRERIRQIEAKALKKLKTVEVQRIFTGIM